MAEQSWWRRLVAAVDREYERRIRAASLVREYGAGHHAGHSAAHDDEGEVAEIVNVPPGTQVGRRRHLEDEGQPDQAPHA
ncbi:MAG: hypothetical protein HXY37_18865 [Chloroflexi bacterium]|nr:hypothetical protein [Chloroflexota bacterium]